MRNPKRLTLEQALEMKEYWDAPERHPNYLAAEDQTSTGVPHLQEIAPPPRTLP